MKRRDFSAAAVAVVALGQGFVHHAHAQAVKPEAGADYLVLDKKAAIEAPAGKVEVVEFFWYACPHCNAFEPKLEAWVKKIPADVAFRRVPVAFRDDMVPQQRLFYVLEAMGKLDEVHRKVFHAIHVEKQALNREDLITAWVDKQGVDKAKFAELYNSFAVSTKARKATQLQDAYRIEGVPSLGIAGRYLTSGDMAGTVDNALLVTDYLIAEARKAK
jgi:thiol:disulfide interchange protein DsbA